MAPAARRLVELGLIDPEFYAAQLGLDMEGPEAAASHFVTSGHRDDGVSFHPLVVRRFLPKVVRQAWRAGSIDLVVDFLEGGASASHRLGPLFDSEAYLQSAGLPGGSERGALIDFLARSQPRELLPTGRPTGEPGVVWEDARRHLVRLARALADRDDLRARALTEREPRARDLTVVVAVGPEDRRVAAAVRTVLADVRQLEVDADVVVVDTGLSMAARLELEASSLGYDMCHVLDAPFGSGLEAGLSVAAGELCVLLTGDLAPWPGWLPPLLERLTDPDVRAVQPLALLSDGTIRSAGLVVPPSGERPWSALEGFSRDDAWRSTAVQHQLLPFSPLAGRTVDLRAVWRERGSGGDDAATLPHRRGAGRLVVEPRSVVGTARRARAVDPPPPSAKLSAAEVDQLASFGLDARAGSARGDLSEVMLRAMTPRVDGALRWSLKSPAGPGASGERWGDTYFIASLANALRRIGHDAVTYPWGAHHVDATRFDDVTLVVRGLRRSRPVAGSTNVLWVISHPDDVSVEELREFDLVFAASEPWSRWASEWSGREVRPLLQATDPELFHPDTVDPDIDGHVVFVGQARPDGPRQIVMDAIAAGVRPAVWGPRWERHIDPGLVRGTHFPNARLARLYSSAAVVLNDHWSDMARHGFISNRLFDAAAAGARVVSDEVMGGLELFAPAVRTYSTPAELRYLCSPEVVRDGFGSLEDRLALASRIAEEHSFAARARTLEAAVLAVR